jgi:hypothetical protein
VSRSRDPQATFGKRWVPRPTSARFTRSAVACPQTRSLGRFAYADGIGQKLIDDKKPSAAHYAAAVLIQQTN